MTTVRVVIFDFIGTLTELVGYSLENAENKMFRSLVANGYRVEHESFFEAYNKAYQRHRRIRYEQLVEVSNAVWVCEALHTIGYACTPQDEEIKTATNVFFEDYLDALKLRPFARSTLQKLSRNLKVGLISNFTYAPVVYAGLRKLRINKFFNLVLVSEAVGWRKPCSKIFWIALKKLNVGADEVVYVGDNPQEDIEGAQNVGLRTIFIPSQFNSLDDMRKAAASPDHNVENLTDVFLIFNKSRP